MRIISCTIVSILLSIVTRSQSRIVADISNLKNDQGVCRACLFNTPASFNGEAGQAFQCNTVPVKNKIAEVVFNNVPSGSYAVFVFHDVNSNDRLDKNFFGIPKEGYGASKNKLPFAGAPAYSANKFDVGNKTTVNLCIKIRNL